MENLTVSTQERAAELAEDMAACGYLVTIIFDGQLYLIILAEKVTT